MNLHEYQAKKILSEYGILVPKGELVEDPEYSEIAAKKIDSDRYVIKAQAHTGDRKRAGGIVIVDHLESVKMEVEKIFNRRLITDQTGKDGLPVNQVLIEEMCKIKKEIYLGILIDRTLRRVVIIGSEGGGTGIEKKTSSNPNNLKKLILDINYNQSKTGFDKFIQSLNLESNLILEFEHLINSLIELFHKEDASLVEINPLILNEKNQFVALDAKISIDSNALFRHEDLVKLRDIQQENQLENRASKSDLNYISLDGNIGCMVNGAGLAMATMDLVKQCNGSPANFLDVGGGVTAKSVTEAFQIITFENKVKVVLVNIFGGIVRCDLIAEGIIEAIRIAKIDIPIVVRLEGTNASQGLKMLKDCGLTIETAQNLTDAAEKAVKAANK